MPRFSAECPANTPVALPAIVHCSWSPHSALAEPRTQNPSPSPVSYGNFYDYYYLVSGENCICRCRGRGVASAAESGSGARSGRERCSETCQVKSALRIIMQMQQGEGEQGGDGDSNGGSGKQGVAYTKRNLEIKP